MAHLAEMGHLEVARLAAKQQTSVAPLGRITAHGPSIARLLNAAWYFQMRNPAENAKLTVRVFDQDNSK